VQEHRVTRRLDLSLVTPHGDRADRVTRQPHRRQGAFAAVAATRERVSSTRRQLTTGRDGVAGDRVVDEMLRRSLHRVLLTGTGTRGRHQTAANDDEPHLLDHFVEIPMEATVHTPADASPRRTFHDDIIARRLAPPNLVTVAIAQPTGLALVDGSTGRQSVSTSDIREHDDTALRPTGDQRRRQASADHRRGRVHRLPCHRPSYLPRAFGGVAGRPAAAGARRR
jgi:hypothetical protein